MSKIWGNHTNTKGHRTTARSTQCQRRNTDQVYATTSHSSSSINGHTLHTKAQAQATAPIQQQGKSKATYLEAELGRSRDHVKRLQNQIKKQKDMFAMAQDKFQEAMKEQQQKIQELTQELIETSQKLEQCQAENNAFHEAFEFAERRTKEHRTANELDANEEDTAVEPAEFERRSGSPSLNNTTSDLLNSTTADELVHTLDLMEGDWHQVMQNAQEQLETEEKLRADLEAMQETVNSAKKETFAKEQELEHVQQQFNELKYLIDVRRRKRRSNAPDPGSRWDGGLDWVQSEA
eukprot:TRINITY_DN49011_c0_g1_i1.p1 TRINITY_DN49011_c0_g1~~TRINITY_DN49011_c0_g1_i1.p1  ORF type:complete len:305 (-),score=37.48 TRINITY_DN49011_c0_g1_i1:306-1184(-)